MIDVSSNDLSQFAHTVLQLASELETEERRIKQELVSALQRNDVPHAMRLLQRWISGPVSEVLTDEDSTEASPKAQAPRTKRSLRSVE